MEAQPQHPPPFVYNPAAGGAFMLPSGWVEYRAPTGQPYWYNTMTRQTSWIFPTAMTPAPAPPAAQPPKKKHQIKKKIPGTHWLFVITPEGYEFYYDRENKKSVWEMPDELEEPMELLKKQEEEDKLKQGKEEEESRKRQLEAEGAFEQMEEAKRIKLEQEAVQQQSADEQRQQDQEVRNDTQGEENGDGQDEEAQQVTEMTEEDIMWQLQQMEQDQIEEGVEEQDTIDDSQEGQQQTAEEPKADDNKLSEEECIAKFNELLEERNISPFAVYSAEYPKLMSDPRFSLIPSHKQKTLFNKYCNALGEKIKQEKAHKKKPEEEFRELLEEKVTKKMYWEDFRRKYKNDPRFKLSHSSMTTKDKEALFKDHVKHHLNSSSKKRSPSPKELYFQLLRDTKEIRNGIRWRDAKKILEKDDRFWMIKAKEEREDLFRDYLEELS